MTTSVAEMYKTRKTGDKWEVYNPENDHVFGTHDTEDEARKQQEALYVNAPPEDEVNKKSVSEMNLFAPSYTVDEELKFPEVPIDSRVNIAALTAGDPNAMFVTRPLAILDEVSSNGLPYNRALCEAIYEQTPTKVARRGHIRKDDKSSAFPPDEGYWVGAVWDTNYYGKPAVFGKCYIMPNTPLHEMITRRRAAGTPISNSIWGDVFEAVDEHGNTEPIGCQLESIDFVPKERAALQALGGEFVVTSEMSSDREEENMADEKTTSAAEMEQFKKRIAEMKPEDLDEMLSEAQRRRVVETHLQGCAPGDLYEMLSPNHRKSVSEAYCGETGSKMVSKEASETSVAEMRTVKQSLAEMNETIKRYEHDAYNRELTDVTNSYFAHWNVQTEKGKETVAALKKNLIVQVVAEMAGMEGGVKKDNVKAAAEKAWPNIKPLAEMALINMTGGSAIVNGATNTGNNGNVQASMAQYGFDPATGRYTDEAVRSAVSRTNIFQGREGEGKGSN